MLLGGEPATEDAADYHLHMNALADMGLDLLTLIDPRAPEAGKAHARTVLPARDGKTPRSRWTLATLTRDTRVP